MKRLHGAVNLGLVIGLGLIFLGATVAMVWGVSPIENALNKCNQGIRERNNVLWAECNDVTVEAAQQSWLDIEQQLRDLVAEKYNGKLIGYSFGEFKILAVNDEGYALVQHQLSFRYSYQGNIYEFTWEALSNTFVKEGAGVWFQSINVRDIGPTLIERGL